jgi:hypothetical protein
VRWTYGKGQKGGGEGKRQRGGKEDRKLEIEKKTKRE